LAKFLRVTEREIKALELRHQFPTLPMEWILRSIDWELASRSILMRLQKKGTEP
jgi:hypothetical protein